MGRKRLDPDRLRENIDPAKRGFPQIRINKALLDRIEAYKARHGLSSRTEAIEHAFSIAEGTKPKEETQA